MISIILLSVWLVYMFGGLATTNATNGKIKDQTLGTLICIFWPFYLIYQIIYKLVI